MIKNRIVKVAVAMSAGGSVVPKQAMTVDNNGTTTKQQYEREFPCVIL
jgi:hypothetical protein